MSDVFAEATAVVTPKLSRSFVKDLNKLLDEAMGKVKQPVIRVKPGLEKGFIGNLRTQVNDAVTRVQGQVKPIRIRVLVDQPSRRALQEIVKGAPINVPGALSGAGGGSFAAGAQVQLDLEKRLSALRAQGAHDFGRFIEEEKKATKARERSTAVSRKQQIQETATQRSIRLVTEVKKGLANLEFEAATKTAGLTRERFALAKATELADKADEARFARFTKETADLQTRARAERDLRLERVRTLDQQAAAGAPAATTTSQRTLISRNRGAADATKVLVAGLRETDEASKALGNTVKELAAQEELLRKQKLLLKDANKLVASTQHTENQVIRQAAVNAQLAAAAQVESSTQIVKGLKDQQREANKQASSEKRRSEQLSRGGQASILSLAGIRGATLAASRSFLAGAAAVTIFANAVKQFADLERNIHVFEATTSATEQQMEAVREQARLLGADLTLPAVTAGDAAGAMVELAKAGLSVEDSIDAARAVLQLATAAAIDNAEATRLVTNVLNAFSLAGTEATDVADTLANAANAAQGSIADIGTAFQQAASAGRQVGLSFQDTAVFLTILAKNGIRGSDAGTSLRTALIRLINPSKKAKEAFQELGISIHDAAGNLRPDVFLQIAAATKEMAPAQRDATIALIGGQDAFRAVTILGRQSIDTFLEMRRALREEGTAAELAAARTKGLHGSIDALQSVLETVGTTMASHVGPGIAGFVYQLGLGITAMSESDTVATALEQTLQGIAGAFNVVGQTVKALSVVLLPLTNLMLRFTNVIGVPTILGAIVAYKAFSGILDRVTRGVAKARAAWAALATAQTAAATSAIAGEAVTASGLIVVEDFTKAQTKAVGTTSKLKAALTAAASSFNVYVAAAAATAGVLIFLVTRESDLERATRKLKEATDDLITSLQERNRLTAEARDAPLQVNAANLGVVEAEEAAARARAALSQSDAAKGTFARTKLELQLAVALDNVEIAQNAYNDAVERASEVEKQRQQAVLNAQKNRQEEIDLLNDVIKAENERAEAATRHQAGDPAQNARLEASKGISKAIQEEIDKAREQNSVESLALANRLSLLEQVNKAIKGLPDGSVDIVLNAPDISKAASRLKEAMREMGEGGSATLVDSILFGLGILPPAIKNYMDGPVRANLIKSAGDAGTEAGETMARNFAAAFARAIKRSEGRRAGLAIQENLAVIGSAATDATLPVLEQQLAQATKDRRRAEARIAQLQKSGQTAGLATAREERARAIAEQRRVIEEIRGINEQLANDAESAARDAETKQKEIFENLLKAFGIKRDRQQQRIEDAQLTEGVGDDLTATRKLRRIAANQIQQLKARIAAAKKQGKDVSVLIEGLKDLKDLWRDLGREVISLQKQQQETMRDILFERFELRIQIAQSRGDVAAEIRIRRQKLEALTKELVRMKKIYGKNSIEWLRVKAAQVAEIEAINELTATQKERKNAAAEFGFQFLQAQSGFVTNLLGNLIPGSVGGLVGGTAVGSGLPQAGTGGVPGISTGIGSGPVGQRGRFPEGQPRTGLPGAVAEGVKKAGDIKSATGGPTRGGQARELHLLNQILVVLRDIRRGTTHTSAQNRRGRDKATMEIAGEP